MVVTETFNNCSKCSKPIARVVVTIDLGSHAGVLPKCSECEANQKVFDRMVRNAHNRGYDFRPLHD